MNNKQKYIIGIDPGKKTGFAIFNIFEKRITSASTQTFWDVYYYLHEISIIGRTDEYIINIEVPNSNHNWQKNKDGSKNIKADKGVGAICRESEILAKGIENLEFQVNRIHPRGKLNASQVKKITGYNGRTNPHVRDAIMLCWQKK